MVENATLCGKGRSVPSVRRPSTPRSSCSAPIALFAVLAPIIASKIGIEEDFFYLDLLMNS